jgi:hypothetical protein
MKSYDALTPAVLRRPVEPRLAPAIRMMQQPRRRAAARERHLERLQREVVGDALLHGPAHDESRAQVENHRQVQPSFARGEVGDVRDPRLIRPGAGELPRQEHAASAS